MRALTVRTRTAAVISVAAVVVMGASLAYGAASNPATVDCPSSPCTITVTVPVKTVTSTVAGPTSTVTVTVTATPSTTAPATTQPPATTTAPTSTTSPPSQTKNCAPNPSACGYPDASNTGVTGPLAAAACPGTITTANAVIEGKSFANCQMSIAARGVVVRNVKLTSSAVTGAAITVQRGASASFSNVDVAGVSASQPVQYAILVASHSASIPRVTIDRAHIHDCIDCISADNTDITNSYFHAMRHPAGAHVDPIQCGAGDGCGLLIRHNTIFNEFSSTSAVALFADFGTPRDSTIDNNLIAGGGYVITGGAGVNGSSGATGIVITNNRFAKILYPYNSSRDCTNPNLHGCYGDITEWRPSSSNLASGNVDDASGNPITLN